ncbi:MFS sugar transporter [Gammaproteobacteria bacterium]|nr:MFS sugar transporter [Gammaproteobacteria bacterium]
MINDNKFNQDNQQENNQQKIQLDDVPLNKFHIKIAGLTFGAHFIDGYILGMIGIALTLITPEMGLNSLWQGLLGASALIGLFIGSLCLGVISDYVGRQKIFLISFVIITVATALQFFVNDPFQLLVLRILIGFGLGGDYSVGHAILSEFSPRKQRGVLLASFSVVWTFGYVLATFVGLWLNQSFEAAEAWRWMLVSSAPAAALILVFRIGTPESPRWLISKGRVAEAQAIIEKFFGKNVYIKVSNRSSSDKKSNFIQLFSPRYIRRTFFNCVFFACIVMPYFAIYTFLPKILDIMNLSANFTTELLLNCLLIIGAVLGIYLTFKMTRRGFLISAFIILSLLLAGIALLPVDAMPWITILFFAGFTLILSAVSNLVGVFPAESFPTHMRSSGIGLATSFSRLGSAVSTFLLPVAVVSIGMNNTLLCLAAILAFGAIISILYAPETKDKTLHNASNVNDGV